MAPEIALTGLEQLPSDYCILDPMSGSGMVLGTAAKLGLNAIGYDLDPLACMISRVNGSEIDEKKVEEDFQYFLVSAREIFNKNLHLSWIDTDKETFNYINFWFAPKQQQQLRALSYLLVENPINQDQKTLDFLKTVVSRLIITKEPKASLARDTAHSRPHRTISENNFDIFDALPKSFKHVMTVLQSNKIKKNVTTYLGDARDMNHISDASIDSIITSPPYLNAIDYMRGHRLSLVWMGYDMSQLRRIRAQSVGSETVDKNFYCSTFQSFIESMPSKIEEKKIKILYRYFNDLKLIVKEAYRVLKPNRNATYVIGNSNIKGYEVKNSDLLKFAAQEVGFEISEQKIRTIPENRRYMPLINSPQSALTNRMRSEHVITFKKVSS
jgi:DNA modification methylase